MDKTGNIVVLAAFRLDKARLRKAQGGLIKPVPRPVQTERCTVHALHEMDLPPEIEGD